MIFHQTGFSLVIPHVRLIQINLYLAPETLFQVNLVYVAKQQQPSYS